MVSRERHGFPHLPMDSSSLQRSIYYMNNHRNRDGEKFLFRVISPAIRGQKCPICMDNLSDRRAAVLTVCSHAYCLDCISKWSDLKRKCPLCNAKFDSWFYKINFSSGKFVRQQLPALVKGGNAGNRSHFSTRGPRRTMQRSRDELDGSTSRSRPLPWRRSFGRPETVPCHVIAERKLQWRASIYHQELQAVPVSSRPGPEKNVSRKNIARERILQRVEPWIQRELEAILGDPEPSIIVHVASSLLMDSLENLDAPQRQLRVDQDILTPLRPFLHEKTNMFWHELRCFAESTFAMDTYDEVVEYKRIN